MKTVYKPWGKELWLEFEERKTPEAQYAASLDRFMPVLSNSSNDGHSWKKHNISIEKVIDVNKKISEGSNELWEHAENMIKESFLKT